MSLIHDVCTLNYSIGSEGPRLVAEVDPGIAYLSRYLIPKYLNARPTRFSPHITIVRREVIYRESEWGRYDKETAEYCYDSTIFYDDVYCWMRCWSSRFEYIRAGLGLAHNSDYTRPPDGEDCFHMTVANRKIAI